MRQPAGASSGEAASRATRSGSSGGAVSFDSQLHERRIHIDKIGALVALLQIGMGAPDAVSRAGCRTVLFGSLLLHAAHTWLLFGRRAGWYGARRTAVVAALLAAVRLLTALSIQGCNNPTSQDDAVTLTFRLLYKTGL
jgi:hypothetical protein